MFDELTDDLLDLRAYEKGDSATIAGSAAAKCCCCCKYSCCCCVSF